MQTLSPDDNIDGIDDDADFVDAEETGYEDIENDSEEYFEDFEDW